FLDSDGQDFDSSPGFSGTRASSIALPDPGGGDASVAESIGFRGASDAPNLGAMSMPSLNLASPPPAQSEQEYLQSLPTMTKIGLALQSFSAGIAGRPNPIDELLKQKRQQDRDNRAEVMNTINVVSKGSEILRKLPAGIQRDAVAAELGKAVGPKYADVFKMVGSEREDELKSLTAVFTDPDVQNQLIRACTGTADFGACWRKQASDESFMKRAYATSDAKQYEPVMRKLAAVTDQLKQTGLLKEHLGADGKYEIPFAKMVELNARAKIFTDTEMDFIRRNDAVLEPFGVKSQKAMEAGAAERAKQAEKPTKEDFKEGQTRRIYDQAGTELQQEFKGGKWVTIGQKTKDKPDKPLTNAQKSADERKLKARELLDEHGIAYDAKDSQAKYFALQKKLGEKEDREGKDNPDYNPKLASELQRAWRNAPGKLH
ncbi:MAG: hypothetical protein AAB706_04095, partial [Patescibacteria group bacterium]